MSELAVIVVLAAMVLYQGIFIWLQRQTHNEERRDLINRLMARDYPQYVQGEAATKGKKQPSVEEVVQNLYNRDVVIPE